MPTTTTPEEEKATTALAPNQRDVFIRLAANHQLELFEDALGLVPMRNENPLVIRADGNICFNFILNHNPGHHNGNIETADLIIVPHTLDAVDALGRVFARKKDSPFNPPNIKAHVLDDPGDKLTPPDPGNLNGTVPRSGNPTSGFYVPAGCIKIRKVAGASGPYKYTIVAVSDNGEDFDFVDPTIKIEP